MSQRAPGSRWLPSSPIQISLPQKNLRIHDWDGLFDCGFKILVHSTRVFSALIQRIPANIHAGPCRSLVPAVINNMEWPWERRYEVRSSMVSEQVFLRHPPSSSLSHVKTTTVNEANLMRVTNITACGYLQN